MRQLIERRPDAATAARRRRGRPRDAGLTLVELVVGLAIASVLVMTAAPYFGDYSINSRLRESGHTLYAEALIAQSEAIKRNRVVRLAASSGTVQVIDLSDPARPVVLRTRHLAEGVRTDATVVDFGSQGWPAGFVGVAIDLALANAECSADRRCPGLRVEAGGAIRLCGNRLDACV